MWKYIRLKALTFHSFKWIKKLPEDKKCMIRRKIEDKNYERQITSRGKPKIITKFPPFRIILNC